MTKTTALCYQCIMLSHHLCSTCVDIYVYMPYTTVAKTNYYAFSGMWEYRVTHCCSHRAICGMCCSVKYIHKQLTDSAQLLKVDKSFGADPWRRRDREEKPAALHAWRAWREAQFGHQRETSWNGVGSLRLLVSRIYQLPFFHLPILGRLDAELVSV